MEQVVEKAIPAAITLLAAGGITFAKTPRVVRLSIQTKDLEVTPSQIEVSFDV